MEYESLHHWSGVLTESVSVVANRLVTDPLMGRRDRVIRSILGTLKCMVITQRAEIIVTQSATNNSPSDGRRWEWSRDGAE